VESSGELLAIKCAECDGAKPYEPSEWFTHIWFLWRLKKAGYPFAANDLSLQEWLDIGILEDEMEKIAISYERLLRR